MVVKTVIKEALKKAKKRAAAAKARKLTKSIDKYNIHAGGGKGPVPIKKQSLQKSTLSGRVYSIDNNKLTAKTMLDIGGGGYGSTTTARFQDSVKDLIGLDKLSIRKAYKRGLKGKKK
jgi:hypothetical protein